MVFQLLSAHFLRSRLAFSCILQGAKKSTLRYRIKARWRHSCRSFIWSPQSETDRPHCALSAECIYSKPVFPSTSATCWKHSSSQLHLLHSKSVLDVNMDTVYPGRWVWRLTVWGSSSPHFSNTGRNREGHFTYKKYPIATTPNIWITA